MTWLNISPFAPPSIHASCAEAAGTSGFLAEASSVRRGSLRGLMRGLMPHEQRSLLARDFPAGSAGAVLRAAGVVRAPFFQTTEVKHMQRPKAWGST